MVSSDQQNPELEGEGEDDDDDDYDLGQVLNEIAATAHGSTDEGALLLGCGDSNKNNDNGAEGEEEDPEDEVAQLREYLSEMQEEFKMQKI